MENNMATFEELAEALQTTDVSSIIPKTIDQELLTVKRIEAPLQNALPRKTVKTNVWYFNTRTNLPQAQATTEAPGTTDVAASNSSFSQTGVTIKHTQVQGSIGKFADKVVGNASVENLLDEEMTGGAQTMAWLEDEFHIYGDATATSGSKRPQWDGFDASTSTSNVVTASAVSGDTCGTVALKDLDMMIDAVRPKIASPLPGEDFFFLMDEPMLSEVGRLFGANNRSLLPVMMLRQKNDGGVAGAPVATIDGGVEVSSYRGIPIVPTGFVTPQGTASAIWANTPAAALNAVSNSAAFAATTCRHYRIEAFGATGITVASSDFYTASPMADADHGVDITGFTPVWTDALGNNVPVHGYRIYLSVHAGASAYTGHTLYGVVSAYDQADNLIDTIRDNGQNKVGTAGAKNYGQIVGFAASPGVASGVAGHYYGNATAAAGDGTNRPWAQPSSGYCSKVRLITRNPSYVVVPTVTELESMILAPVNARTIEWACIADLALAVRSSLFIASLQGAATQ
jgi:hypothetical protein